MTISVVQTEVTFSVPCVSGVLSNMQQFFDSLRTNLESLESLPHDEKEALLGQAAASSPGDYPISLWH
jgi:hypothetical protein